MRRIHDRHGWWALHVRWNPEPLPSRAWWFRGSIRVRRFRLGPVGVQVLRFRTDHECRPMFECEAERHCFMPTRGD